MLPGESGFLVTVTSRMPACRARKGRHRLRKVWRQRRGVRTTRLRRPTPFGPRRSGWRSWAQSRRPQGRRHARQWAKVRVRNHQRNFTRPRPTSSGHLV